MRNRQTAASAMAPITADDMARFHRNAPAALARRSGAFLGEELSHAFELLLVGLVPIIGMLAFDWSAGQLLIFMLAGAWTGILIDLAKLILCYNAVKRFGAVHYDDWHVWTVASALRQGKTEAVRSHLEARYQPEMGVVVDLLFGGVGTLIILAAVSNESTSELRELLANRSVLYGIAGVVGYRLLAAAWEIGARLFSSDAGEMKVAVGMRGVGLFVLMFIVVMIRESAGANGAVARSVMLIVNGALVAWAVFNAVGQLWVSRETGWLRDYLQQHAREGGRESARRGKRK